MRAPLPQTLVRSVGIRLSELAGRPDRIVASDSIGGGCIHNSVAIRTDLGGRFFLKWAEDSTEDVFPAESDGLEALRSLDCVKVPEVLGFSDPDETPSWLLLEFVPRGQTGPDYWETLGRGLANLHRDCEEPYGWERSNFIGSLPQANDLTADWGDFWWSQRILPQLTRASEANRLPGQWDDWKQLEGRLPVLLPREVSEPALLHGDLWSGNVFPGPLGVPVLVDPAVYRGHSEVDLAMTELFGGFPDAFYAAYRSVREVEEGYNELRRPLYQLYPLLVHVNLFGGSYIGSAAQTLATLLKRA